MGLYEDYSEDELEDKLDELVTEKLTIEQYPAYDADSQAEWKEVVREISNVERLLSKVRKS